MESIQDGANNGKVPKNALRAVSGGSGEKSGNLSGDVAGGLPGASGGLSMGLAANVARDNEVKAGVVSGLGAGEMPLDNTIGDLRPLTDEQVETSRLLRLSVRYDLRRKHRTITTLKACSKCGYPAKCSAVFLADAGSGAVVKPYFQGCVYCGSAWACFVCAAKVRYARAAQIATACTTAFVKYEMQGVFVTLTMAHGKQDSLQDSIKLMSECKRWVFSQGHFKRFLAELHYFGAITVKEVTHNFNYGWHPHMHMVMFFIDPLTDEQVDKLQQYLWTLANKYYVQHGRKKLSVISGVHVEPVYGGRNTLGDYLQKLTSGWDVGSELARGDVKKGRNGSRTYFQIASDFFETGDCTDLELIKEYEQATRGMHSTHWTKGFKGDFLPKDADKTDEELAAIQVGGVRKVRFENWLANEIVRRGLEPEIFTAWRAGGFSALIDVMVKYELEYADGLRLATEEETREVTALDVKLQKEAKIADEKAIQARDRTEAELIAYERWLHKGHWRYWLAAVDAAAMGVKPENTVEELKQNVKLRQWFEDVEQAKLF